MYVWFCDCVYAIRSVEAHRHKRYEKQTQYVKEIVVEFVELHLGFQKTHLKDTRIAFSKEDAHLFLVNNFFAHLN